ncbi:HEAT repeat domain-containing protein [Phormidesmis sp. 146-35]
MLKLLEPPDFIVRGNAADALGTIRSDTDVPGFLKLVEDSDFDVRRMAAHALGKIAKKHPNAIAQHLPHLLTLIPTDAGQDAHRVILAIQENCKYYNYEIFQDYLEAQKNDRPTQQESDRPHLYIQGDYIAGDKTEGDQYNIDRVGNLNTGDITLHGDQIGEQHNHTASKDDRTSPPG